MAATKEIRRQKFYRRLHYLYALSIAGIFVPCLLLLRADVQQSNLLEMSDAPYPNIVREKSTLRKRLLFFCHCADDPHTSNAKVFSLALERIPHLVPDAHITSHVIRAKSMDGGKTSDIFCEDEVERLIAQTEQSNSFASDVSSHVFYTERFSSTCHKLRKMHTSKKVRSMIRQQHKLNHSESWIGGSHLVPYPQEIPATHLRDWGEVWQSKGVSCDPSRIDTLHTYRSKGVTENQHGMCNMIHVPTIIRWALDIHERRSLELVANETLKEMLTRRLTYKDAKEELEKKDKFVGLVTLTTWKDLYPVDALVRHALCRLLTRQYKPCDALAAYKGALKTFQKTSPSDTYKIQSRYKFIIAMANEISDGYLVEKTIHPYLANSIAISASPSLPKYLNGNRPVICSVPKKDLDYVDQYRKDGGKAWMPFNTTQDDWGKDTSIQPIPFHLERDEPLIEFVADQWTEALQPCIDEIVRLDRDDESYIAKLTEPFVTTFENSLFDGSYVGVALLKWLAHMNSPVTVGIEDMIFSMKLQ